ncbi:MAG TPA: glycoside hydrolase family protein [Rummeliibacillus sp.]|nr:glycoside hydrolase family protein [Rummeliibacillus sp.]
MNISQVGINLIKSFEGLVLHAYKAVDTEKYYTIGYGHYGSDVRSDQTITAKQAEDLLKKDIQKYVDGVNDLVKVKITQNMMDALTSFCYNCGVGALRTSNLLKYLNVGDYKKASDEFIKWNKSGGKVLKGLVIRREAERTLFLKDSSPEIVKYKVRSGDNLTKIAKRQHTTVSHLLELNPSIKNPNIIIIGQLIKVPKV